MTRADPGTCPVPRLKFDAIFKVVFRYVATDRRFKIAVFRRALRGLPIETF